MLGTAATYLAQPGSQPPHSQSTPKHQIEPHRNLAPIASHLCPSHDERLYGAQQAPRAQREGPSHACFASTSGSHPCR
jgi:hypothetical protein